MNAWLSLCMLAQNTRAEQFVKGFREGNGTVPVGTLLIIALSALVIATLFYVIQRFTVSRERGRYYSDRRLLLDLARLHRLDHASLRLLRRLAAQHNLSHAAEIFVRPELFVLSDPNGRHAALLERLREKLFSPAKPEAPAGPKPR